MNNIKFYKTGDNPKIDEHLKLKKEIIEKYANQYIGMLVKELVDNLISLKQELNDDQKKKIEYIMCVMAAIEKRIY